MPLCDTSLKQHINNESFVTEETLQFFYDLSKSIESLHEVGYTHNDLMPDNILLTGNQLTLIDYGFAKKYYKSKSKNIQEP